MRRKQGALVPLEKAILESAKRLKEQGICEFYGFQIASQVAGGERKRYLTGYGTVYRALSRLVNMNLLTNRWEDTMPMGESRPRRKYYQLLIDGQKEKNG